MATVGSDSIVGVIPEGAEVEVVKGSDGNDAIVTKKPVSNAEFEVKGDTGFTGQPVSKTEVSVKGNEGESTTVAVQATFKSNTISNDGEGSLNVNVVGASFKKSTVASGDTSDAISFDGNTRVVKAKMNMGGGDDSITFAKGGEVKGKNTIDLGKGGNDAVVIEDLKNIKGTLVIKKFRKGDTITVNGKVYTYADRKALNKLDGIRIKGK